MLKQGFERGESCVALDHLWLLQTVFSIPTVAQRWVLSSKQLSLEQAGLHDWMPRSLLLSLKKTRFHVGSPRVGSYQWPRQAAHGGRYPKSNRTHIARFVKLKRSYRTMSIFICEYRKWFHCYTKSDPVICFFTSCM